MKSLQRNKIAYVYAIALAMLVISVILGIALGSTELPFFDAVSSIVKGDTDSPEARILLYVRVPRVLASLVCGMALSVSGAVIQGVLANRLASPSIIGVNAGAGLAVVLCSAFGVLGGWRLSLFSFVGAFATVMLVSIGAKKMGSIKGNSYIARSCPERFARSDLGYRDHICSRDKCAEP